MTAGAQRDGRMSVRPHGISRLHMWLQRQVQDMTGDFSSGLCQPQTLRAAPFFQRLGSPGVKEREEVAVDVYFYTGVRTFTQVQNMNTLATSATFYFGSRECAFVRACVRARCVFLPTGAPKAAETPAAAPADTKSRFSVSLLKYSKICTHGQNEKHISRYATILHTKSLCLDISDEMK